MKYKNKDRYFGMWFKDMKHGFGTSKCAKAKQYYIGH